MSPGFVETNVLIALGISVDAVALTLCDFEANARWRRALAWVCAVTLTHSLLPVAGLTGVWLASELLPAARTALCLTGAAVSAALLWRALEELRRSPGRAFARAQEEGAAAFAAKVALVSVDAALIGPGAGVVTDGWNAGDLLAALGLSTLFVGGLLTAAAGAAWWFGHRMRSRRTASLLGIARLGPSGVALPIFSYFFVASLTKAVGIW